MNGAEETALKKRRKSLCLFISRLHSQPILTIYVSRIMLRTLHMGSECDVAMTSITPLIIRVDLADPPGQAGVPFLPHYFMDIHLKLLLQSNSMIFPIKDLPLSKIEDQPCSPARTPNKSLTPFEGEHMVAKYFKKTFFFNFKRTLYAFIHLYVYT